MKFRIIFTILILSILLFTVSSCNFLGDKEFYIFENIDECKNFENLGLTNLEITRYETPEKDRNLKSLEYDYFYAAKIESDEIDFEIFAYTFKNSDDAKQYFKNETGKTIQDSDSFSGASNMVSCRLIVIDERNIYIVRTKHSQNVLLSDILSTVFSKQIYPKA